MTSFTIHEPVRRDGDIVARAEAVDFVKEGFAWWALFFPLLWLIYHRMWIVLAGFVGVLIALQIGLVLAGFGEAAMGWFSVALSVVFATQANDLRRWSLARRGYEMVGAVTGSNRSERELKFFSDWVQDASAERTHPEPVPPAKPAATGDTPNRPKRDSGDDVIGLFPEADR